VFYKVIYDKTVIDVLNGLIYILYQPLNNIYLICGANDSPCGIQSSTQETFYHLEGMNEFPNSDFKTVKLVEIDEEEYEILKEALGLNEEIIYDEPEEDTEPTDDEIIYDNTLEMVRNQKIKRMSAICEQNIVNGIDVELSDGNLHHFSLTVQDQLNLTSLFELVKAGETSIAYHADGELCKYYSAEDIIVIVNRAKELITYHTTYFNSLQSYILALDSIEAIGAIEYGVEIPAEYQSDIWKEINQDESD
jgi:hypothetical protein